MDQILQVTARGDADQKLQTICSMIINIAAERFGLQGVVFDQWYCGTKSSGGEDLTAAAGAQCAQKAVQSGKGGG